jgi:hypothetical protein
VLRACREGALSFEAMYPDFAAVWPAECFARFRRQDAEHDRAGS